jgi:serine/threonine protein kinase
MAVPETEKGRLFIAAAELSDPARRAAFLDAACGDDAALRAEIEDLLRHDEAAGSFLEAPALAPREGRPPGPGAAETPTEATGPGGAPAGDEPAATIDSPGTGGEAHGPSPKAEGPGTRIGPYKLLQQIGEGGMGAVYLAEQEHPVRRKVALKIIKPGMDTAQVVARFEAERQALALMDHPNIAKVLDAGATDSGRPFFVMELVKGVPITEYCDEAQLTPRERLELFVPVCQAIQHAHQKGIIHRDVKPSNVLVTLVDGRPVPRVIDFGIAKATDQRLTERTLFTEHGAIVGTMEYMSPEQAEVIEQDVDTRSDIYSLGVLLYELLTGTTPLERSKLREAGYAEILRRIREEEPPRPSTRLSDSGERLASIAATRRTEPARLTRLVRGELDWIVMRALEKDRTQRYETANGLARDVRRYLDGDPVEACPPSRWYRLRKFARRHRAALAIAGAFALLLVAATAVSAGLALRAERERVRAMKAEALATEEKGRALERERMAIDAVKRFGDVIRASPELKHNPSLAPLRASLLREPQAFFKALRDRLDADKETSPDSLDRLATANTDLGNITDEIGDKQDALHAYERALAIRQRLVREHPWIEGLEAELAWAYRALGNVQRDLGRNDEAIALLEQARFRFGRLVQENPSAAAESRNLSYHQNLAGTYQSIGTVRHAMGQRVEAVASYKEGIAILERLSREHPSNDEFPHNLAAIYGAIAHLQGAKESLASHERARTILERLTRDHPAEPAYQLTLAATCTNIGVLHGLTGRRAEALASYERCLPIFVRLTREYPSVTQYRFLHAASLTNLGGLRKTAGQLEESAAALDDAQRIIQGLIRDNPTVVQFHHLMVTCKINLGQVRRNMGRMAEALSSFEQAAEISGRLAREHLDSSEFASSFGVALAEIGAVHLKGRRFDEARAQLMRAVEWQKKAWARNTEPRYRERLAGHLRDLIRAEDALGLAAEAEQARRELSQWDSTDFGKAALDDRLAAVLKGQAPANDAERLQLALQAYEKKLYAVAARLCAEALANDPGLGSDPRSQLAYSAACVAALAGCGRGKDEPPPDEAARVKLRRQAIAWLKSDLQAWRRVATTAAPGNREEAARALTHSQNDPDLACVRDDKELARLPEGERAAFKQLWHDVDQLLAEVSGGK